MDRGGTRVPTACGGLGPTTRMVPGSICIPPGPDLMRRVMITMALLKPELALSFRISSVTSRGFHAGEPSFTGQHLCGEARNIVRGRQRDSPPYFIADVDRQIGGFRVFLIARGSLPSWSSAGGPLQPAISTNPATAAHVWNAYSPSSRHCA